jgi:SAM-dependent methyltransferase
MKFSLNPGNLRERIALALDLIPRPLGDVLLGPLLAKAVIAASSLGVFNALADRPRTVEEVGAQCGSDVEATGKLLRALYASGYLKWRDGLYGLTRMSQRWLLTGSAKSMHFAVLHRAIDLRFMDFDRYVRTGESRDFHKELTQEDWVCYHSGQASQARLIVEEVSNRSPIPAGASEMLDLGGGHGLYSLAFCQRHPGLHSRVLDLATPLQRCTTTFLPGIHKRVQFEVADIRTASLGTNSADVALIANVIHHFDESINLCLLNRVAGALRPGGIVIVLDLVRPNSVCMSSQIEALLDLYFGAASGAQLWTVDEIRHWQERSGLQPLSPISLRLLPDCTIQTARKP